MTPQNVQAPPPMVTPLFSSNATPTTSRQSQPVRRRPPLGRGSQDSQRTQGSRHTRPPAANSRRRKRKQERSSSTTHDTASDGATSVPPSDSSNAVRPKKAPEPAPRSGDRALLQANSRSDIIHNDTTFEIMASKSKQLEAMVLQLQQQMSLLHEGSPGFAPPGPHLAAQQDNEL